MYVNHPSLTQSVHWISFSAVLHGACDWFTGTFSLKLEWHTTPLWLDARWLTHARTHTQTYKRSLLLRCAVLCRVPPPRCQRGLSWVPTLPKKTPLRWTQGRHVQPAAPTSVGDGLKTGMSEACLQQLDLGSTTRSPGWKIKKTWFWKIYFKR